MISKTFCNHKDTHVDVEGLLVTYTCEWCEEVSFDAADVKEDDNGR